MAKCTTQQCSFKIRNDDDDDDNNNNNNSVYFPKDGNSNFPQMSAFIYKYIIVSQTSSM
jgi:hypothetical protein